MQYDAMRHFADTWGLIMLAAIFVGVVIFVLRPGSARTYSRLGALPLDGDEETRA